jgi:hypothetical protein
VSCEGNCMSGATDLCWTLLSNSAFEVLFPSEALD